jgi:hypothetical protein
LEDGDTLVDRGFRNGIHDALISYLYPTSYFILEDINAEYIRKVGAYYSSNTKTSRISKSTNWLWAHDSAPHAVNYFANVPAGSAESSVSHKT